MRGRQKVGHKDTRPGAPNPPRPKAAMVMAVALHGPLAIFSDTRSKFLLSG